MTRTLSRAPDTRRCSSWARGNAASSSTSCCLPGPHFTWSLLRRSCCPAIFLLAGTLGTLSHKATNGADQEAGHRNVMSGGAAAMLPPGRLTPHMLIGHSRKTGRGRSPQWLLSCRISLYSWLQI